MKTRFEKTPSLFETRVVVTIGNKSDSVIVNLNTIYHRSLIECVMDGIRFATGENDKKVLRTQAQSALMREFKRNGWKLFFGVGRTRVGKFFNSKRVIMYAMGKDDKELDDVMHDAVKAASLYSKSVIMRRNISLLKKNIDTVRKKIDAYSY